MLLLRALGLPFDGGSKDDESAVVVDGTDILLFVLSVARTSPRPHGIVGAESLCPDFSLLAWSCVLIAFLLRDASTSGLLGGLV